MKFPDLPQEDKVTCEEIELIKWLLPGLRTNEEIPGCMYTKEEGLDYDVFILLAWVIARRENKDITGAEVGNLISVADLCQMEQIEKEILYFYTWRTRDEIGAHFKMVKEAAEKAPGRYSLLPDGTRASPGIHQGLRTSCGVFFHGNESGSDKETD